jgi:ligand-binding SRPBCC domain-containing protein
MTCAITEYEYPNRFVDEQQRGPFRRWWDEHSFTATGVGAAQMIDVVEFRSPLGPLGLVADPLLLERYLPYRLRQRNAWLKNALEAR